MAVGARLRDCRSETSPSRMFPYDKIQHRMGLSSASRQIAGLKIVDPIDHGGEL